ncbi:MAG: LLM class F420-dependent oxidoreductase [Alphaproteobacteria bacterium]|nr:LLM class F420-dependent oxidoreductase [Alphaproteobacteria bacterium]
MQLGLFTYNVEYGARPDDLARAAEERGFEGFWVGEHTHIPASRQTPYPGPGPLPKPYYHMADPFVSLMAAAAVTKTIKLGTGVCLVAQHHPIALAKTVATLDHLSGGRVLLGVGGGWNREECENHGVPFPRRWKYLRESVEAMKRIWREEEASYDGDMVRFERIISYPKPAQAGGPPVIYGGATEKGRERVARYCDGWIPIDVLIQDLPDHIADVRRRATAHGRNPDTIEISVFAFQGADLDALKAYRDMGVKRTVLVTPRRLDDALKAMDHLAGFLPQVA